MENMIEIFNENGELKSREQFLKEMELVYDSIGEEINQGLFDEVTNPETQIEVEPTLETFDFLERSVYLTEEITPDHANSVFEMIKFWNKIDETEQVPIEERKPIQIYINTPGGDLNAVFSIISSIKISKTPVHTINIGTAYSGGFFICLVGHKRYGLRDTSFMFHEGAAMDEGDSHKILQHIEFYKHQLVRLKDIVISNSKITDEEYEKHKKDDWFMSAEDAITNGVIDEIIETIV